MVQRTSQNISCIKLDLENNKVHNVASPARQIWLAKIRKPVQPEEKRIDKTQSELYSNLLAWNNF